MMPTEQEGKKIKSGGLGEEWGWGLKGRRRGGSSQGRWACEGKWAASEMVTTRAAKRYNSEQYSTVKYLFGHGT